MRVELQKGQTEMGKLNRRAFIRSGFQFAAFTAIGSDHLICASFKKSSKMKVHDFNVNIPLPVQIVIDDVGWWSGKDGSSYKEPYRTGIQRDHIPADYEAIVTLGKKLGVRPQAAMVLCEWDKNNILRNLPTATWMGKNWKNSKWVGPWQEEAAEIMRGNPQHFEITLHGVGHEYWEGDNVSRAEWADENGIMRDPDQVEKHLDFFEMIMLQHNLGPFPASFVPAAFRHSFGRSEGREISMAEILEKRGIYYINTPFHLMNNAENIENNYLAFDGNILTVNRGYDLMNWNDTGIIPQGVINGPTCGMHWANLIHPDPERNMEIVNGWVSLLSPYKNMEGKLLAINSNQFQTQLLHHVCTKVYQAGNEIRIDFSETDKKQCTQYKNELTLQVTSVKKIKFTSDNIQIFSQDCIKREGDFMYILGLKRDKEVKRSDVRILID